MKLVYFSLILCFLSWDTMNVRHNKSRDCIVQLNFKISSTFHQKVMNIDREDLSKKEQISTEQHVLTRNLNICFDNVGNCSWNAQNGTKILSKKLLLQEYDGISFSVFAIQQSIGNSPDKIYSLIKDAISIGATKTELGNGTISLRLFNKLTKTIRVLIIDTRKFTLLGVSDYNEQNELKNKIVFSYITIKSRRLIKKSTETVVKEKDDKLKIMIQKKSFFKADTT